LTYNFLYYNINYQINMEEIMKYILLSNEGKVEGEAVGDNPGDEWIEVPDYVQMGDWIKHYDDDWNPIPIEKLIVDGIIIDKRGRWFNTENPNEYKDIDNFDIEPPANYTKETPIKNEMFQFFDRVINKWVEDTEKKARNEKEKALGEALNEADRYEKLCNRPVREIRMGIDVDNNLKYLTDYQAEIDKLKPKINKLRDELKSA